MKLILASASPRRREILKSVGLEFDVFISNADEESVKAEDMPVGMYVQELALFKAGVAAKSVADRDAIIISADTIVYNDGKILGKPKDREDAFSMIKSLSGKCHSVFTGICVMRCRDAFSVCKPFETKVCFRELTDSEIWAYIDTLEYKDKAGGYGIQGIGSLLVDRIEGDYFNVVGLPVSGLCQILKNDFDFDVLKGER